jgi:hypothetical protein
MRLPRARFTVRRMMVVVAVAGVALQGARLAGLSLRYRRLAESYAGWGRWPRKSSEEARARERRKVAWAHALARKYERAARAPWLPVEPDPPEPK